MRPSFEDLYMQLASGLSLRSTCKRLSVGCVITSADSRIVYGVGYNGNYSGGPNGCDTEQPGACGDIHAEENAIINCSYAARGDAKHVYCTHLPCVMCAKKLINLGGVKRVVFRELYRIQDSLELFRNVGIEAVQYQPKKEADE